MTVTHTSVERPAAIEPHSRPGDPPRILYEGLVAGAIGYAVLAVLIAAWGWARGYSPLHAAALLGGELFYGVTPSPDQPIDPAHVLSYNGAHLAVFLAFGFVMAWLAGLAERIPQGWYLLGTGFLFVAAHVIAFPLWFDETVRSVLPAGVMATVTTLAFAAMAGWLLREHPGVRAAAHEPD